MRPFGQAEISIRSGLVLGVVALVLLTAGLIHLPWSLAARANVTHLALALNRQSIEGVSGKMSLLLDDAVATQQAIAAAIMNESLDLDSARERETLFKAFMESRPTFSAVEFGWLDDRSYAVQRLPNDRLRAEETTPDANGLMTRQIVLDTDEMPAAESFPGTYAVTAQFWFKQAYEIAGASWSDIYPMVRAGELGFTVVSRIDKDGAPLGVLGVSIALSRISRMLDAVQPSPNAAVFLTNGYRELVALQAEAGRSGQERGAIKKLEEGSAPLVRIAANALRDNGIALPELRGMRQLSYTAPHGGETYYVTLAPLSQMGLIVGLVVPQSDVLGAIERNTRRLLYALAGFVALIALIVSVMASKTLGKPLVAVTANARLLGDLRLEEIAPVPSRLAEFRSLSHAIGQMSASLASFKKYIPTDVVRTLLDQGMEAELGGDHRDLSIFFMDLVNFTRVTEALGDGLIPFLGEYLSAMSDEIRDGGGTIDKYIGDAIMAFWGAPIARNDHALGACRAALACQTRLARMRASANGPALQARIGINTGRVLVGNVGSRDRLNYTAIGDPVNVASRLEALNKRFGSEIIIGEETYSAVKDHVIARPLDRVAVYGRQGGIEIFELLALRSEAEHGSWTWVQAYEAGLSAFRARAWDKAHALFSSVSQHRGAADIPSELMIGRIAALRKDPPPDGWDALLLLSEK